MRNIIVIFTLLTIALPVLSTQRKLVNGSFEEPIVTNRSRWQLFNQAVVPGWSTTDGAGNIELWRGLLGIVAPDGQQLTEMNSTSQANLFQNVCLSNGEAINWSFWHRGRNSNDRLRLMFGSQVITDVTTGPAFQQYSGTTAYTGVSGNQNLTFVSVSSGGGSSLGNLLDGVVITLPPYVEFLAPANASVEGVGDDIPRLLLNGELSSAATVDVVVTGGTAANGTDFTNVETVNIPAGDYDGTAATSLPINLTINNTFDLETNETINFGLANPTGGVIITDADCDGNAQLANTYTITDDDALVDIEVSKDDTNLNYLPGATSSYTIVVTNNGPGDVMNAQFTDNLPNGLSINGTVTCTTAAPSSCVVTSAGADPVEISLNLAASASATITIPVQYSEDPADYLP